MVKSININYVRNLCDKVGFDTKLDDNGVLSLAMEADEDYNYNVLVAFAVTEENDRLIAVVCSAMEISQKNIADALIRINKYNADSIFLTAYLTENGNVRLTRTAFVDKGISEESLLQFIEAIPPLAWEFYKNNFKEF